MRPDDVTVTGPGGTGPRERSWAWHLTRASGLALIALIPVELVWVHVIGDASWITGGTVLVRWSSPFWRVLDWTCLMLALMHGAAGLHDRFHHAARASARAASTVAEVIAVLLMLSTTVIVFSTGLL